MTTTSSSVNDLPYEGFLPWETNQLFHQLRKDGNQATQYLQGDHRTALSNLKYVRQLGIWFQRTFGRDPHFKPWAFIPPKLIPKP